MVAFLSTPCFAQGVATDGIFSIEGTCWLALPIINMVIFPIVWFNPAPIGISSICFSGGEVFFFSEWYNFNTTKAFYLDMLVASIFTYQSETGGWVQDQTFGFGIIQPLGIGMMIMFTDANLREPFLATYVFLLVKTDDNWIPPDVE
jgi:hypothetical protein